MTSRDADQIYSYLLKYLRIKTHSVYKIFIMDACEIQQRQLTKCNSKTLLFLTAVFHTFLFLYTFSIWIYFLEQNLKWNFLMSYLLRAVAAVSNLLLSELTVCKQVCCWQRRNTCFVIHAGIVLQQFQWFHFVFQF